MINFEYFFNLINIFRDIKLQSKYNFFIIIFSLTNIFSIFSQEELNNIKKKDSIKQESKNEVLLDKVRYNAKNYVKIDKSKNKLYLYDEAELYYQDIELRAGIIILDYSKNEVYAGRISNKKDSLVQTPYFKQANNEVNPDSIRFNFDTQKALIWNSKSGENGMDIFSALTKKQNDSVYYIKDARVSTAGKVLGGETEDLDYYFKVRKGKLIPGGKIITGFTNMFIADIPTPLALPFAYFPTTQTKESGFVFPSFGESNNRGYYLQNGGYYLALSDYFDLSLTGDYYTNGSYGFRGQTIYNIKYKFRGNFNFRYENLINSERGLPDYGKSTVFNLTWSHSKDSKSSPNSNFSASVNFGSSDYYQKSLNQLNSPNFLNNNLSSSISYSRTFPEYPRVTISLTSAMSQNSRTNSVNLTLPTFTANLERIFPFAPKNGSKKGIIQNINLQYNTRGENRIITNSDDLFSGKMFDNSQKGMVHTIPLSTNFKILKHISVSSSANYRDVWVPKTIKYKNFNPEINKATRDTISGFDRFGQYNYSASMGATIYGILNFGDDKKIQSIRHVITPSISFSNTPSFKKYYDTYIIDAEGNTAEYTRFAGNLNGIPTKSFSNSMGISIGNTFEAKVKDKDSTATELKKISLLNNLNISTSHNFAADSLKWSPVRVSTGLDLINNRLKINFAGTFDPYALDEDNVRYNKFNIANGGRLLRLTSANINMNFELSSDDFSEEKKKTNEEKDQDEDELENDTSTSANGGRDDDLFGRSVDPSNRIIDRNSNKDIPKYPSYMTKIPWNLKFAHSFTYRNTIGENIISNNSLMVSGNLSLTPKWEIGVSSGYDFKLKGVTYTQLRFDRDLDSWLLNFSWTPFGPRQSWNFFIGIKSGLLSDIKYDKTRQPDIR